MDESKTGYLQIVDDACHDSGVHHDSFILVNVEDHSSQIWKLKLYGGYLKYSWILALIYHLANISFAAWLFKRNSVEWCPQFKISIFAIQFGSAILYLVSYRALRFGKDITSISNSKKLHDQNNIVYVDIKKKLQKQ